MSLLFLLGAGKWMVQGLRAFLGPVKALPDVRGFTIKSLRDGMELGWPEIKGHLTGRLWDPTMYAQFPLHGCQTGPKRPLCLTLIFFLSPPQALTSIGFFMLYPSYGS